MSFSEGIHGAQPARSGQMLIMRDETMQAMKAHAEEGYPHEVCGLLLGEVDAASRLRRVREAEPARNLNLEWASNRYELDPTDYLRIDADARRRGLAMVGVYHSHPEHPAQPSETDRVVAAEIWESSESWSYLILALSAGKVTSWQSWILRDRTFHEEELHLEQPESSRGQPCQAP